MPSLTVRADEELLDALDEEFEERPDTDSRADLLRHILRNREEMKDELAECESRIGELETELERVRREKRQIIELRDEHEDAIDTMEREQSLAEKRARAGLATKLRWSLFGMREDE